MQTLIQRAQERCGARSAALGAAHQRLLRIAHLLEPDADPATGQPRSGAQVRQQVEATLEELCTSCDEACVPVWLQPALRHLVTVLRRLGEGLYYCYDVPGLPRTDNSLEQFYRQVKAGERRITGHKRADSFVVRVGGFAVYASTAACEPEPTLRQRLMEVPAAAWHAARAPLRANQDRQTKMRRFRLHRAAYLADLEARWSLLADSS